MCEIDSGTMRTGKNAQKLDGRLLVSFDNSSNIELLVSSGSFLNTVLHQLKDGWLGGDCFYVKWQDLSSVSFHFSSISVVTVVTFLKKLK